MSYFWYDLYSGILHVVLDEPANISLPFIGQPCLEFQWHHFIPSDIAREHFLDVAGDLNIAVSIMVTYEGYLKHKRRRERPAKLSFRKQT